MRLLQCSYLVLPKDSGIDCRCVLNQHLLGCFAAKTNQSVIVAWLNHKEERTKNFNLCTNGDELFSYDLLIGFTRGGYKKMLLDYTAPTNNFVSMTTSRHINLARPYADHVVHKIERLIVKN